MTIPLYSWPNGSHNNDLMSPRATRHATRTPTQPTPKHHAAPHPTQPQGTTHCAPHYANPTHHTPRGLELWATSAHLCEWRVHKWFPPDAWLAQTGSTGWGLSACGLAARQGFTPPTEPPPYQIPATAPCPYHPYLTRARLMPCTRLTALTTLHQANHISLAAKAAA